MNNWFEVDRDGFRALQSGKPKFYAVRELIQNALDEDVKNVDAVIEYNHGTMVVSVTDDGAGFRDLKDAWTLFADTYKRPDPTKRGRFNMGEKQAFSICRRAEVETTSGTVEFDESGRHRRRRSRESGTKVTIELTKVTTEEKEEILTFVKSLIVPYGIKLTMNGEVIPDRKISKSFVAKLKTEYLKDGDFRTTTRNSEVELYHPQEGETAYLYELGIPVCEIECKYHINVMQRIPMSMDRDKVSQAYMQDLFAEVLNHTHKYLDEKEASDMWVRSATSDDRVSRDALESVKKQRYGDKVVVATPNDPISIDDALADGSRVVYGSELSKDEWEQFKKHDLMNSSTAMYGMGSASYCDELDGQDLTPEMCAVSKFAIKVARELQLNDIWVKIVDSDATLGAWYGDNTLTLNVRVLGRNFFKANNLKRIIAIIIHELCHEYGMHTEKSYHEAICDLGAKLYLQALRNAEDWKLFQ